MSGNKSVQFIVRQMQSTDFEEVRQIWALLGFLNSKYDNTVMSKVDANGLFVAQELNSGKLLGACSGVNLSPHLAFVGQYSVLKEYQKLGIGLELWRTAMQHMGQDRNIGLFARGVMFETYRDKCNFSFVADKRCLCFTGKVDSNLLIQAIDGISVVPIDDHNIQKVIEYDKQIYGGLDRTLFIETLSKTPESVNKVAVNENNEVLGYCFLVVSVYNTAMPEPLYANDHKIAELLLSKCCQSMPISETEGMIYSCFDTNTEAVGIAKKLGLEQIRELPNLFTKKVFEGNEERVYCLSSRAFYPF